MRNQLIKISKIYTINIEDPGDYYFRPEGVLFVDEKGHPTLFSTDSRHNFLKSIVQKFTWAELEEGVVFREHSARLIDVTDQHSASSSLLVDEMLDILHRIYDSSPRQFFFLEKYL
jgi:hypothetical protein